jgi:hypothetical protein
MNLALNSTAEALIRHMVSSGQFDSPESVVETALFQAFSTNGNAAVVKKQIVMDPPTSLDDGTVIELPHRAGIRVTAIPTTKKCIPDPIDLAPGLE